MALKSKLIPFDKNWGKKFEGEAALLKSIFGKSVIAIHHVGSTAIPGICAKPEIDIHVNASGEF